MSAFGQYGSYGGGPQEEDPGICGSWIGYMSPYCYVKPAVESAKEEAAKAIKHEIWVAVRVPLLVTAAGLVALLAVNKFGGKRR